MNFSLQEQFGQTNTADEHNPYYGWKTPYARNGSDFSERGRKKAYDTFKAIHPRNLTRYQRIKRYSQAENEHFDSVEKWLQENGCNTLLLITRDPKLKGSIELEDYAQNLFLNSQQNPINKWKIEQRPGLWKAYIFAKTTDMTLSADSIERITNMEAQSAYATLNTMDLYFKKAQIAYNAERKLVNLIKIPGFWNNNADEPNPI